MAEDNNSNYAGNLARAVGQGITFGFGDELEARFRALTGDRSYDEEVADIRESIEQFRETNPVAAYGSEIVGSIPTGLGLAGLALRGGLRGAAKIGALEGGIYGVGEGEGVEGTATSAAIGAGLGGALGKAGEKAFEGIAPLVGKFMKRTRGSGIEAKGSGNIEMDSSPSDLGPMVRDLEAGSDEFVPMPQPERVTKKQRFQEELEAKIAGKPYQKTVGEPGTPGPDRSINKPLEDAITVAGASTRSSLRRFTNSVGGIDYLPIANALTNNTVGAGKKGLTGAQYLARLKNQPSVTDLEMEVSGLDKFLAENSTRKISVDDVLEYHLENSPRIEMVDGGARHVSDQRMFGDESYTAQGKNVGGGYEEIVFRDARFVGNRDTAPGAFHSATHHTNVEGGIGHGRMTSFVDEATRGERSTMLEENQADLWSIYKGKNRPDEGAQKFVQLTPDKVKSFKAIDEKIEDSSKYRTLNDALNDVDAQNKMLKEIESNQRIATADLSGLRKRNFLEKAQDYDVASPELQFGRRLNNLMMRSGDDSLASRMGREMEIETDLGNIIKQSVIEDTIALNRLSDDQLSKVLRLAADRSLRLDEGSRIQINPIVKNPLDDAELKEALSIPEMIPGLAEEDMLMGAGRLVDSVQNEFKNVFEKRPVLQELSGSTSMAVMLREPVEKAVTTAKNLLPKVAANINPKLLRKDADSFKKISSEGDLFKQSIDDQKLATTKAKDRVMNIYGDAIEDAAPDKKTAFEYLHYRQNQGNLAVSEGRLNTLATRFSTDDVRAAERGFADAAPNFTNPLPFETQDQVARYQLHQMIKKAADDGSTRFYIPDYRDLAAKRDLDVTDDDSLAAYVSRYKTPQEKVIKELKQKYPGIDIGTVDVVAPVARDDFGEAIPVPNRSQFDSEAEFESAIQRHTGDAMREIPEHDYPMTYIDLKPLQAKPSQVRRYKRGGPVDMRSGIGDLFRVYS